jgi:hypothetical protein
MAVALARQFLLLKRATLSRPSGQWNDDDYDVLADGVVVGRIFKANASPVGASWMWTLAFEHHQGRVPTHGYAEIREAAMAAFAKSWRTGVAVIEVARARITDADGACSRGQSNDGGANTQSRDSLALIRQRGGEGTCNFGCSTKGLLHLGSASMSETCTK